MKRLMMFVITVFVVLPLIFTSCKEEDDPQPASMTFVDDAYDVSKEFTIYENLEFKVKFVEAYEDEPAFAAYLTKGTIVSGKVRTSSKWKDDEIIGEAYNMKASNNTLTGILKDIGSMEIVLEYDKSNDGDILAINVHFPESSDPENFMAVASESMMGGTYFLKE